MAITRHQKDTGTTIALGPTLTAEPQVIMTEDQLESLSTVEGGNAAVLANTIVSFAVHENMGINLFRMLASTTQDEMLRSNFLRFIDETATAVEVYEQLQDQLGIPLGYISPLGRCTESLDQHVVMSLLTSGSADPVTLEMACINAATTCISTCVANVELLAAIGEGLTDRKAADAVRNAVAELLGPATEHLEWATFTRTTMTVGLCTT